MRWVNQIWQLGAAMFFAGWSAIAFSKTSAFAQSNIVPDNTLGAEKSEVLPLDSSGFATDAIIGGAVRGSNLFHSFKEFSIPEGREAYFFNESNTIQNILARVTGSNRSEIFGKLGILNTTGITSNPNLFLINPNGIVFGENAQLDVGGSFIATTASSVKFADGNEFSTTPQSTSLLTISVPLGLQFGANPGSIQAKGEGQGIRTTGDLIDTTAGLQVLPLLRCTEK
jgi:filamentous hemagglutinin family protein